MKRTLPLWLLLSAACAGMFGLASRISAQGFVNLNFEHAGFFIPASTPPGIVPFNSAFSGWNGYFGNTPANSAYYNQLSLNGISDFALLGTNTPSGIYPLAGRYTAVLQGSSENDLPPSLAQTGIVPAGTMSLQFLALGSQNFFVSMGGQQLPLMVLQDFGFHKLYGADVSGFAGQTAELRFTQSAGALWGNQAIDDISFSTDSVPEPSTWALFTIGSALFWCVTRRRRRN